MTRQFAFAHPALANPAIVALSPNGRSEQEAYAATVADQTLAVDVERTGDGQGVLRVGDRVWPFCAARSGNRLHVWLAGRTYAFDLIDGARRAARPAATGALANLIAPMPGAVRAIRVAAGDTFTAHAPLVVLESMKMEMTLSAPADGKVTAVLCSVGDLVEMGATLLELTKATSDDDAS